MKISTSLIICLLITITAIQSSLFALPAPTGLMCELLANPEVTTIGDSDPEFSWIMNSNLTGDYQTAYQVMVASSTALLDLDNPDLWNSDKVVDNISINVAYNGTDLSAQSTYFWKVRIWNNLDQVSSWSEIQEFHTGSALSDYNTARYSQVGSQIAPVSVTSIEEGRYLVDFGKDAFGYIIWTIPNQAIRIGTETETILKVKPSLSDSISDGSVQFHFGEKLEDGIVDRSPGGTIRYYQTSVSLDGSEQYESTRLELPPVSRSPQNLDVLHLSATSKLSIVHTLFLPLTSARFPYIILLTIMPLLFHATISI